MIFFQLAKSADFCMTDFCWPILWADKVGQLLIIAQVPFAVLVVLCVCVMLEVCRVIQELCWCSRLNVRCAWRKLCPMSRINLLITNKRYYALPFYALGFCCSLISVLCLWGFRIVEFSFEYPELEVHRLLANNGYWNSMVDASSSFEAGRCVDHRLLVPDIFQPKNVKLHYSG